MHDSPLLSLPAELRNLILTLALPREIPFDYAGTTLCENPEHPLSSPCLGLRPSCISPFTLLFINKQLRREVLPLLKDNTNIYIASHSSLSTLLPHLGFIYEIDPNTILPFRWYLHNAKAIHLSRLEAAFANCERYPHLRDRIILELFEKYAFYREPENKIGRLASVRQLYPTFGSVELDLIVQHSLKSGKYVTLSGFLPFTLSRQPSEDQNALTRKVMKHIRTQAWQRDQRKYSTG